MLPAEHLTIFQRGMSAFAPGNFVIRVHFFNGPMLVLAFCRTHGADTILAFVNLALHMDIDIRHQPLELYKSYSPEEFPTYDTFDAIECGKYSEIPADTDKIIGVPITYLAHHCNEQFEIIGEFKHGCDSEFDLAIPMVNGKAKYTRIAIRKRKTFKGGATE